MGLHFLGKMKIMVVRDIERDEVEFICKVDIRLFLILRLKKKKDFELTKKFFIRLWDVVL